MLLVSVSKDWNKPDALFFSVEHLLNEELEVTEQTIKKEKEMFVEIW